MDRSAATGSVERDLEFWQYDGPPTPLDLVQNNVFSNGVRLLVHALLRVYLRACHRYRVQGSERPGGTDPALIVANHASHLDVAALFAAFPLQRINRVRALAAKDYFFTSALLRTIGFFVANAVPLDRQRLEASLLSFCRKVVSGGGSLIVFPEGTRSVEGRLRPFRPGVGMLAKKLGVRVVPAYIDGTYACLPKGALWPRFRPIAVRFGEPIDFGSLDDSREGWIAIADRLHERIRVLSMSGSSSVDGQA
jgi:1-acyl-sn-glycerol-3-phosphate acyltransferase